MRLRRLYFPALVEHQQSYALASADAQFHYLVNVLRVKPGQALELFDGQGVVARAEVSSVAKKVLQIETQSYERLLQPSLKLHLYLSVSKGDRMDYALQKSTELGVSHITPVWSDRGEVKLKAERLSKKESHWQGVISSACEQAYQNFVPVLKPSCHLSDIELEPNTFAFVCDASGKPMSQFASQKPEAVHFFVGPEGGWTEEELVFMQTKNIQPLGLGPRILRTETAPVVMLSLAQHLWGDLH